MLEIRPNIGRPELGLSGRSPGPNSISIIGQIVDRGGIKQPDGSFLDQSTCALDPKRISACGERAIPRATVPSTAGTRTSTSKLFIAICADYLARLRLCCFKNVSGTKVKLPRAREHAT
jgi:hypothetical protein